MDKLYIDHKLNLEYKHNGALLPPEYGVCISSSRRILFGASDKFFTHPYSDRSHLL